MAESKFNARLTAESHMIYRRKDVCYQQFSNLKVEDQSILWIHVDCNDHVGVFACLYRSHSVGRDESDDKSDDFDSFTECGRTACECRRRVTCAMDDAWWKSSRHRMSQETVGSVPSSCPAGGG
ncbi:hypothetical protein EVAR_75802_1 [Eumeta japonica]|uniref:Uncharacterized protein n=1 Tax=Eumeta variegata TaxID=151549 RepID=A0A4C1TCX0_EUMVA|nr:hypothetical protein EVAR_75802_1 [Eumeta japonica]